MKVKDIRELSVNELQLKERDLQQELFNLKFQFNIGQLEKPGQIRIVRKDLSRIKLVLHEKDKGGN